MPSSDHPEKQTTSSPFHGKTLHLSYGPKALQFAKLHMPSEGSGSYPTVILIHGGFWRVPYGYTLMTGLAQDLAARGIAAWNIEYRRVGDVGGGWPATLLDVAHAADYLRTLATTYNLDLKRVMAVGHSAGGHLALWLAAQPRLADGTVLAQTSTSDTPLALAGAISLAGVSDLDMGWRLNLGAGAVRELLGGGPDEVPERYAAASPAALLPLGVPQVLIHGTEDDRVPFEMSRIYTRAAQVAGDDVTLIELEGVDHFALIDPSSKAWITTVEAVQKML